MKRLKTIGCGCLIIVIILIILGLIFSGTIIKKLISGAITQKTGVVIQNLPGASGASYTDPKTGATLNIGNNKIPDNFPKDFPIYPNSTVTSSWTANNFELTLTTKDSLDKVISYYTNNLQTNGWTAKSSAQGNWVVTKNNLTGFLTTSTSNNLTSIIVVLGEASPTP